MTVFIRGKVKLRTPATKDYERNIDELTSRTLTEGIVDANSPSHSLLSLYGREYLGRILESDWPFAQGVANGEEVDEPGRRT